MPKHTGMSQEKKKTRTQKNGAAIRASVEANSRNGALPRRHRRPPAAASAAPPLGTPGCWPHQTPRFSLPLVPIGAQLLSGGGALEGLGVLAHVDLQRCSGRCRGSAGASQAPVVAPV